ncbi:MULTISPECIES: hypothetical protein [Pelosinus]|uniref:hypothetical protein n=1 Tax=Pelosinus TaxID=365348 RepID=UPI00056627DC|nr:MULTISPECIES: hypothetical protein [Pelosinus]
MDKTKEELQLLFRTLLNSIEGCRNTDCSVCRKNKSMVRRVAKIVGVDAASIMPEHLKGGR